MAHAYLGICAFFSFKLSGNGRWCAKRWENRKSWVGNEVHRLSRYFFFLSWPYTENQSDVDSQVAWYRGHTWKSLSHAKFCVWFLCFLVLFVGEAYRSMGSLAGFWPKNCSWSPNCKKGEWYTGLRGSVRHRFIGQDGEGLKAITSSQSPPPHTVHVHWGSRYFRSHAKVIIWSTLIISLLPGSCPVCISSTF